MTCQEDTEPAKVITSSHHSCFQGDMTHVSSSWSFERERGRGGGTQPMSYICGVGVENQEHCYVPDFLSRAGAPLFHAAVWLELQLHQQVTTCGSSP